MASKFLQNMAAGRLPAEEETTAPKASKRSTPLPAAPAVQASGQTGTGKASTGTVSTGKASPFLRSMAGTVQAQERETLPAAPTPIQTPELSAAIQDQWEREQPEKPAQDESWKRELARLQNEKSQLEAGLDLDGAARVQQEIDTLKRKAGQTLTQQIAKIPERAKNVLTGSAKNYAAALSSAASDLYGMGQSGRDARTRELAEEYQRQYDREKQILDSMRETARKDPARAAEYAAVMENQEYLVEDLKRKLDAVSATPAAQAGATKASRELGEQIAASGAQDIERAGEGLGILGKMVVDAGASTLQTLGDMAIAAPLGVSGLVPMAVRSFGSGAQAARQDGGSEDRSALYGVATAAKEVITEKLFGLAMPFAQAYGGGSMDDLVQRAIQKAVEKLSSSVTGARALETLLGLGASAGTEGLEELIGDWMEWQMPRIYGGEVNSAADTLSNSLYDFAVGAISGGLGDASGRIVTGGFNALQPLSLPTLEDTQEQTPTTAEAATQQGQNNAAPQNGAESTTVDTNPADHTPAEQAVIQEYQDGTDETLAETFTDYLSGKSKGFARYNVSSVSQRQATDAARLLGGNYAGYKNAINSNAIRHILNEHGPNGSVDQSFADLNDAARMGYVLDNYDNVEVVSYASGDADLSAEFRTRDNRPAPMLRYSKRVNGTYFIVEAIPESKYKKFWVVSAYMEKADGGTQAPNAKGPRNTPSASLASSPSAIPDAANQTSLAANGDAGTAPGLSAGPPTRTSTETAVQPEKSSGPIGKVSLDTIPNAGETTGPVDNARSAPPSRPSDTTISQPGAAVNGTDENGAPSFKTEAPEIGSDIRDSAPTAEGAAPDGRASLAGTFDTVAAPTTDTTVPQPGAVVNGLDGTAPAAYTEGAGQAAPTPTQTGGMNYGAGQQAGGNVSDGGQGRVTGEGAGGQAGGVAARPGRTRQATEQIRRAADRQNLAQALQPVSTRSLGLRNGSDAQSVKVIPEGQWDAELRDVAERVQRETGKQVTFVLGNLWIETEGGVKGVRGVWTRDGLIVQADNMRVTPTQIADHEIFHDKAFQTPGLVREIEDRIVQRYGEEELRGILQTYLRNQKGIIDVPEGATELELQQAELDVLEEVFADAYAGINAFRADAPKYAPEVNETLAGREGGTKRETAAATDRTTGPPRGRYSYAGRNANRANSETLAQAEQLERDGADPETIRQETGWFRGMDGLWRWEIDDSGMEYHRGGDARFQQDHPGYARHQELVNKMFYGTLTEEEMQELRDLDGIWGNEYAGLSSRVNGGTATLENLIIHDELFRNYPQLRDVRVRFTEMEDDARGSYNRETNTITLSRDLRNAPEETLLHEVQHAIQYAEGFTSGASPEYWSQNREGAIKPQDRERIEAAQERVRNVEDRFRQEWRNDELNLNLAKRYNKLFDAWSSGEQIDEDAIMAEMGEIESAAEEGGWDDLLSEYGAATADISLTKAAAMRNRFDPYTAYKNTAGEIEARDAAARRNLTQEQRRQTPPDLGDENTVFAEGAADDYALERDSIKEQLRRHQDELADMEPAASVQAPEGIRDWNMGQTRRWIINKLRPTGFQVDRQGLGTIVFDEKRLNTSLDYLRPGDAEAAAYAALPRVLKRGVEISSHENHKGREYGTITIAAPVEINGQRGNMAVVVKRTSKNFYKMHRVLTPDGNLFVLSDEITDAEPTSGGGVTENGSLAAPISSASESSIAETGGEVKTEGGLRGLSLPTPEDNETTGEESGLQYSISETVSEESAEITPGRIELGEGDESARQRDTAPERVRQYLRRAERTLTGRVSQILGVPAQASREILEPIVQELEEEYLDRGTLSGKNTERLFERAWREGREVDREYYDKYKPVKDYLRRQAMTISKQDAGDIADWAAFKKSAFGTLRLVNEGGLPVDSAYMELQEIAPELFPHDITAPSDMLQHMLAVAQGIQVTEWTLDQAYGQDAAEFKRWARRDFDEAIRDAQSARRFLDDREKGHTAQREPELKSTQEVAQAYGQLKVARRELEKVKARNLLTEEDMMQVGRLMRGEIQLEHLRPEKDNVNGIRAVFEAKREYERYAKQIRQWNQRRKAKLREQADTFLETANDWKDKPAGILYARETMERNIRDIVKDKKLAKEITDTYFRPVHQAAADANRLKNQYRDAVRALDLSRKTERGNQVSEAHAVQLLGEAEDNIRVLEESRGRIKTRDGKSLEDWKGVVEQLWTESPNLDREKIQAAVGEFRKIYDELFQQMNEARVRNGYEPVNYRQGYFPHFQPGD